jgi:tubulin polyglutamylase TTLL6/13
VAQRYLHKPYLIDNLKFDLRVYVLVTSVCPLRIFIYEEGLARFATSEYVPPVGSNLQNLFMHLTNYAINKDADNFQQNQGRDDQGHKRSMTSIFRHITEKAKTDPELMTGEQCWQQIKNLTVKTIIACH